jgi:hypothetical protein
VPPGTDDELFLLPQPATPTAAMHPTTAKSTAERRSINPNSLPLGELPLPRLLMWTAAP